MTNEARSPNDEKALSRCSSFGDLSFFRVSLFGFRHFSLSRLKPERKQVLFVDIGRGRRRCRFQKRSILVFLVQRFDWDGAPDFDRFLILRLDRNCFSDLWSGFGCLSTGPASADVRCFHCTVSGYAVGLLICDCFSCWLRRRLRFQRWLKRIVRILVG